MQINDMMTNHRQVFVTLGLQLYQSFTVILICWFGITSALSGEWSMYRFAKLMMTIAFGLAMIKFYDSPMPGLGISFADLVLKESQFLANQLNEGVLLQIKNKLDYLWLALSAPSFSIITSIIDVIRWVVVVACIIAVYLAVTVVIAFGYVALAISLILGPVFIPFFIVPEMEWLFWGWLKSFIQYAFYPVVANGLVFVFGSMLVAWVDESQATITAGNLAALIVPFVIMFLTFVFAVFKIPSLTNSIFTGRSGESITFWR